MKETKFEYLASVMHRFNAQEGRWSNARVEAENHIDSPWQPTRQRVCSTEQEARMFINWLVNKYKATGLVTIKGVSSVQDDGMQIVKTMIKRREVTEYEVIDEWSE